MLSILLDLLLLLLQVLLHCLPTITPIEYAPMLKYYRVLTPFMKVFISSLPMGLLDLIMEWVIPIDGKVPLPSPLLADSGKRNRSVPIPRARILKVVRPLRHDHLLPPLIGMVELSAIRLILIVGRLGLSYGQLLGIALVPNYMWNT